MLLLLLLFTYAWSSTVTFWGATSIYINGIPLTMCKMPFNFVCYDCVLEVWRYMIWISDESNNIKLYVNFLLSFFDPFFYHFDPTFWLDQSWVFLEDESSVAALFSVFTFRYRFFYQIFARKFTLSSRNNVSRLIFALRQKRDISIPAVLVLKFLD